jgi:predicted RNA-binding protein with PIN domain
VPFLIDGSNLLGATPGLRHDRAADRDELRRRLLRSPTVRRAGMTLVFDGAGHGGQSRDRLAPNVEIRYSGPRRDADTLIRSLLDRASPNHYVLVTDDRELRDYARIHRFRLQGCTQFLRQVSRDERQAGADTDDREPEQKRSGRGLSKAEIQDWLDYFEGDGED